MMGVVRQAAKRQMHNGARRHDQAIPMFSDLGDSLFTTLQHVVPQQLLSRFAGYLSDAKTPWLKNFLIKRFAATYGIDMN